MSDVDNKIKMIVEGLLLAAGKPLSLGVIASVFNEEERPDNEELRQVLGSIAEDCNDRGFELKEVASGFRFQVKQDLSEWIARLWDEKPPRYSRALLETLALIAYRQPITRGDIEEIRGVAVSSNIVRTLLDREWVRVVGHKDVPGKPALLATTKQFLDYFNLKSIQELPPLSEIRELAKNNDEFDLEDDFNDRNVLELPDEAELAAAEAEADIEFLGEFNLDDLPEEDEAVALAKKPLDEILGLVAEESAEEQEQESDQEQEQEHKQESDEANLGESSDGANPHEEEGDESGSIESGESDTEVAEENSPEEDEDGPDSKIPAAGSSNN